MVMFVNLSNMQEFKITTFILTFVTLFCMTLQAREADSLEIARLNSVIQECMASFNPQPRYNSEEYLKIYKILYIPNCEEL